MPDASGGAGGSDASAPPLPPEAIYTGIDDPYSIAVDDQSIFALTAADLRRFSLKNTMDAPVVIAEGLAPPATPPAYAIAVDANYVHWFASSLGQTARYYFSCPAAGCFGQVAQPIYDAPLENPTQLKEDEAGTVRISQKFDVLECKGATCSSIGCVSADSIRSFVMDGSTVYWAHTTDPGGVYFCTPGVPAVQLHAEAGAAMAIVGDTHYVMSALKGTIFACKKAGCGGAPTAFAEAQDGLTSMAADEKGVYWTTGGVVKGDGSVKTCPLSGCEGEPFVIASGQDGPTSITLRGDMIYWANRGAPGVPNTGSLMRAGR
jgi:hypothetical protein